MHVLALPKWYPGRHDPQLGDFIRKQVLATARQVRMSVLCVVPLDGLRQVHEQELAEADGAWELRCYYRPDRSSSSVKRKLVNYLRYRKATALGLARLWKERGRPDLVHVHILLRPALTALSLRRRHGIPFVVSEQSSEYLDGRFAAKPRGSKALHRHVFRKAAAATAVSRWLGDGLVKLGLCERYDVVPNVVPGLDHPLPPRGPAHAFMVVADLVDGTKNVSGVLRALAEAQAKEPALTLDLIGDGPDGGMLKALASSLGLDQAVRFHGRLANTEVLRLMAGTGSVIINSNVETFSVVTGEALASGKPVIATRCGGPTAFITPENGLLIDVRRDDQLTEAMLRISRTHLQYDPASVRASVSDRFSVEAVGSAFHAIYQRLLSHGR
jgi:glycosyltransferase involved in cell wall biosynthesis